MSNRTSHAERIGEPGAVIRYDRAGKPEMVNLRWGLQPADPEGRPFEAVRAEGRVFPDRRCLVPASEFFLVHRKQRYKFTLTNGDWFYFAGIWRPATPRWPASYAVLTIAANPDVAPYGERQMCVLPRANRMDWLNFTRPEEELLQALPEGSFRAELDDTAEQELQAALAL